MNQNNPQIGVRMDNPLERDFLFELAREQGLEVYIKSRSSACVYFNTSKEQVEALLEQARISFFILGQRRMEMLAEAMLHAGSKKYSWFDRIKQRQANIAVILKKNPSTRHIAESVEKAKTANAQNTGLMTETIGTSLGVCANTKKL